MDGAAGRTIVSDMLRVAPRLLPFELAESVRLGLTAIAAIYLGMLFELDDPEWAGFTVLAVSLATRSSSLQKSVWRAGGSVVGATMALLLMAAFAQDTLAFDIALALWLAFVTLFATVERGQRSYGFALMGFTVPIITLGTVQAPQHTFFIAFSRCSALLLGIGCAHVSSVFVARSVQRVSHGLAGQLRTTATRCERWLAEVRARAPAGLPPLAAIIALDESIAGALVEQPSLRTGGRFIAIVPYRLLRLLTQGLLAQHLPQPDMNRSSKLLAMPEYLRSPDYWMLRIAVVERLLRQGRRIGLAYAPARSLSADRDWVQARNNAIRTIVAVSSTNAIWYFTAWPSGRSAATWSGLLSALFASAANSAAMARNFLYGGLAAAMVGVTTHYTALTVNGHFGLLAAVLLPIVMLAALGKLDDRSKISGGFAMLVLTFMGLYNVSTFDLAADLNVAVGNTVGMAIAVAAFTACPPPADATRLRRRARRRMTRDLRRVACERVWPSAPSQWVLPGRFDGHAFSHLWLGRMSRRMAMLAPDASLDPEQDGRSLLLCGALLIAMRLESPALWAQAGQALWQPRPAARAALAGLAARTDDTLQRERLDLLGELVDGLPGDWPGLPPAREDL